jgi:hypothetical protein
LEEEIFILIFRFDSVTGALASSNMLSQKLECLNMILDVMFRLELVIQIKSLNTLLSLLGTLHLSWS